MNGAVVLFLDSVLKVNEVVVSGVVIRGIVEEIKEFLRKTKQTWHVKVEDHFPCRDKFYLSATFLTCRDERGAFTPQEFYRLKKILIAAVCAEAYNPNDEEDDDAEPQVVHPKTDEQRLRLQDACRDILLFKTLEQEQFSEVLDGMFEVLVKAQEHIIDQGDDGDNFYVIENGVYDIFVQKDKVSVCVGKYDNKGSFGELALMYNTPRAASIIATQDGALWGLDRATFHRMIVRNNVKKRRTYEAFIECVPLLKSLELSERMKIVDVVGARVFKDGECLITQGDEADCFYIVESGEAKIMIKSKVSAVEQHSVEVEVARCSRGQYFGELALVTNKPRAASVYAVGETRCLVIDVQAFERLLGPCMDIMKRNISQYEEQRVALFGSSVD
ncbi:protein kinase, cAMP-dependent, regulatory, type II, alpha, B [Pseudoliparis swirei]|uniref:protein kinase, cAMP-dependent, regulatory, type II, alpha, B n=1 Tax=Pseudoliparis swirei TaxID=2059687 RepID=UPI0024BF026F|nr:protein kinase, cAMP-dependent, regulatory, type II, alpha, B [Pseudoliparis swirei]